MYCIFLEMSCAVCLVPNVKSIEVLEIFILLYKDAKVKSTQTNLAINCNMLRILISNVFIPFGRCVFLYGRRMWNYVAQHVFLLMHQIVVYLLCTACHAKPALKLSVS